MEGFRSSVMSPKRCGTVPICRCQVMLAISEVRNTKRFVAGREATARFSICARAFSIHDVALRVVKIEALTTRRGAACVEATATACESAVQYSLEGWATQAENTGSAATGVPERSRTPSVTNSR